MEKSRLSLRRPGLGLLISAASLSLLTGCASSFDPLAGTTPPLTAIGTISGHLHGGQGPIVGASVYLYQVSNTAYGGASLQLADPVLTSASGGFSITSYTTACTSGLPVYLYAVGGNAGGGANSAAGLLAAPGSLAIDGSGNVWYNLSREPWIEEMVGAATPVTTPLAYGAVHNKLGTRP